jgi:tetratricopeptide (TPR) repeat protein
MSAPSENPSSEPRLDVESPWIGLHSFSKETSSFFFGRQVEMQELFERVVHKSLTILFGQSGLGKTSLIKAALVPQLVKAGYLPVRILLNYDNDVPLERQVLDRLRQELRLADQTAVAALPEDIESLWLLFHQPDYGMIGPKAPRPVLIFDQFEEIFTLGSRRREAVLLFRESLAALVENRVPASLRARLDRDENLADRLDYNATSCKVLLSLREDFLYLLERWRRQMPSLMDNRMELRLLTGAQALQAVVEPGRLRPGKPPIISSETGTAIVRFVAKAPEDVPLGEIDVVPPLLSLICERLNARRLEATPPVEQIQLDQLQGQSEDILQDYYAACFAGSLPALQHFVEDHLLSPDGFRESVSLDRAKNELARGGYNPESARLALKRLVDEKRLLVEEDRGGNRRIELTHDILTGVVRQSREKRREREEAERVEKEKAELAEREARQRRQLRRAHAVSAGFILLALVAVAASLLAANERHQFDLQQAAAEQNKIEAAQSRRKADDQLVLILVDSADKLELMGRPDSLGTLNSDLLKTLAEEVRNATSHAKNDPASLSQQAKALATLSGLQFKQGDSNGALENCQAALKMQLHLAEGRPDDSEARMDLAKDSEKLGGYQDERDDKDGALASYRQGEQIALKAMQSRPTNLDWQEELRSFECDLSLLNQTSLKAEERLVSANKALEVATQMTAREPHRLKWQAGLAQSQVSVGVVRLEQKDFNGSINSLQQALEIYSRISEADPDNLDWQQGITTVYKVLGVELYAKGDPVKARSTLQSALDHDLKIAEKDPKNSDFRCMLALDYLFLGRNELSQGEKDEGTANMKRAVDILEALTKSDRGHRFWQSELAETHYIFGARLEQTKDYPQAEIEYTKALFLQSSLAQEEPENLERQVDVEVTDSRLGILKVKEHDENAALKYFQQELHVVQACAAKNPKGASAYSRWQWELATSYSNVGFCQKQLGQSAPGQENYAAALKIAQQGQVDFPKESRWAGKADDLKKDMASPAK